MKFVKPGNFTKSKHKDLYFYFYVARDGSLAAIRVNDLASKWRIVRDITFGTMKELDDDMEFAEIPEGVSRQFIDAVFIAALN